MPFLRRHSSVPERAPEARSRAALRRAEAAFQPVFRRLFPRARAFAQSYVGNIAADDVAQEALICLWECAFRDGDSLDDVDALLYRILRRRIADHLKTSIRSRARENDDVLDLTARLANQTDTALVADGSILASRLAYLTQALPPATRRAFELYRRLDGSVDAVARQLGLSLATARWHIWEATRRLRTALTNEGYDVPAAIPRGRSGGRHE